LFRNRRAVTFRGMECWLIPFRHDAWATRQMLERCRSLSHEQFHRRFDLGVGSVHDTFRHIISAMARWADRIGDRPLRPSLEIDPKQYTIDELLSMLGIAAEELESAATQIHRESRLEDQMSFVMPDGSTIHFTRAAAMVHVTTHGVHHRSQARYMLRQLGLTLAEDFDPVEWEMAVR
jgi:uncharacterized damage-inducible protein DinB